MIKDVAKILVDWPEYSGGMRNVHEFNARITLPIRLGKAALLHSDKGDLFFTWAHLTDVLSDIPTEQDWLAQGPFLWIMDLVYSDGVRAIDAMRAVSNNLLEAGIVKEGDIVLFWRGAHERHGYGRARRRSTNVIWTQDHDHNSRPLLEHAQLAEGCLSR